MSKYPGRYAILEKFDFEKPPVGVKFLPFKPQGLERPGKLLDLCEMLAEAQKGKAFYATQDDFTCIGPMLLGMREMGSKSESGLVGVKLGVFKEARANRRIYQILPRLSANLISYVAFAPLDKMDFDPDILIIMASVSQAEVLNRARSYTSGEPWTAKATTVAGCAWLYIYPYLTGEINLTVTGFGFGMKARRLFPEGRILMTIPWDRTADVLQNLSEIEWAPESFSIGPEAHKKKMQRIREEVAKES
jgi:uncharacterized protein (DUF169 family)